MDVFSTVQGTLLLVLGVVALACEVFALVDALRHRPDAYVAAGKRTKTFWTIVLAVALGSGSSPSSTCSASSGSSPSSPPRSTSPTSARRCAR